MSDQPVTVAMALKAATCKHRLARLDAEVLLAHALEKGRSWLYSWPEYRLTPEQWHTAGVFFDRRQQGEPVAYITGRCEFYGLSLTVTHDTLIPRPETEELVDVVIELANTTSIRHVLDLGTGSGAIALALAEHLPQCQIHASDASGAALAVAQKNARNLALKVHFHHGHWFGALDETTPHFDIIVGNPPYIDPADKHLKKLSYEPRQALVADNNGLADLFELIEKAPGHLAPGGFLWLEHGSEQGQAVRTHFTVHGYQAIVTRQDLAGLDRITGGRYASRVC